MRHVARGFCLCLFSLCFLLLNAFLLGLLRASVVNGALSDDKCLETCSDASPPREGCLSLAGGSIRRLAPFRSIR